MLIEEQNEGTDKRLGSEIGFGFFLGNGTK